MKNIFSLLKYATPYKKHMIIAILAMVTQVVVAFAIPYIMQIIIDEALVDQAMDQVVWLSAIMLGLAVIGIFGGVFNVYSSQYISQHASAELRLDLFNKIQTLSFKNIDDFKASRLITNATNDVMRVQMFFTMMLRIIIRAPMMIVIGLVLALSTSLKLSQVFFVTIPILVIAVVLVMLFAYPRFKKVQVSLDDLNNTVLENANAPQVIKSFVSQPREKEKFETVNEKYRKVNTSAESVMAVAEPVILMIFNLGVALILLIGTFYFQNNDPAFFTDTLRPRVGLLMAFNQYSQQILIGLMMFAMMMIFVSRADVSAQRINEIFAANIDLTNAPNAVKPKLTGAIKFDNVCFGYGQNGNYALKNVSFEIKAGEKLGIIGSTGSGKTSLVSLVPRLYDTKEGTVYLDEHDVKNIDIKTLRDSVGFVTQQAVLFSGSLGTNILQGKVDADLSALEDAAKDALLYDYAKEQEGYFNHLVKAKGTNLSGGQKQRVSIARALIKKSPILVLDDATSAVDLSSERKILNAINEIEHNPTMLLISQKVATVRRMDRILVLNNQGEVDGLGTHSSLMKDSKVYQEIVKSQLGEEGEHNA